MAALYHVPADRIGTGSPSVRLQFRHAVNVALYVSSKRARPLQLRS